MDKGTKETIEILLSIHQHDFANLSISLNGIRNIIEYVPKMLEEIEQLEQIKLIVYRLMFTQLEEGQSNILQSELVELFRNQVQYDDEEEEDEDSDMGLNSTDDGGTTGDSNASRDGDDGSKDSGSWGRYISKHDDEEEDNS